MIFDTQTRSIIAQASAARDAEHNTANRERLELWAMRYPYDLVTVPETRDPPTWPAIRSSMAEPTKVTQFPSKASRR